MLNNNSTGASSSASLFKLFQNLKQTESNPSDEMSSETNSSSFSHSNTNPKQKLRQKKHENSQKKHQRLHEHSHIQEDSVDLQTRRSHSRQFDEQNKSNVRTTSFSQLRQRSLSSFALGSNNQNQCFFEQPQSSTTTSSINQSASTNSTSNNSIVRKSVGIQHPPMIIQDPTLEASTIVCMLVDRNNAKTSEELMAVAARAARAYKRERTSGLYNNYSTKASLPDLTFLKDYTDDKPRLNSSNKINEHIKSSTSAATITQTVLHAKEKGNFIGYVI